MRIQLEDACVEHESRRAYTHPESAAPLAAEPPAPPYKSAAGTPPAKIA